MSRFSRAAIGALSALVLLAPGSGPRAQTDDVFAFIPPGGRSILSQLGHQGMPADEFKALVSGKRTSAEWLSHLKGRAASVPALKGLGDNELATLADYLAANMPLPTTAVPADPAKANLEKILPSDGRDLTLNYCQSCHIVTVVITQDRTRAAWLGTMNKPSHIEIELTPAQRGALADYLVRNGGIPIDQVPEELRAGGASY
jgi:mono/diheme cytochrome c family protein